MGLDSARAYFAQRQQDLFRSTCTITRSTPGTFDENTGEIASGTPATIYSGPCLVRSQMWQGSDTQTGQEEVRYRSARLKLPPDTAIEKDDVVTVTTAQNDPDLVGRVFRITDVLRDDWQIVRVAILEETT
jgi:hypothetical protein